MKNLQKKSWNIYLNAFYKKDQSRSRVAEGSGLGLAIAKSIVDMQGGDIRAKYEDGLVQFIISLPIAAD